MVQVNYTKEEKFVKGAYDLKNLDSYDYLAGLAKNAEKGNLTQNKQFLSDIHHVVCSLDADARYAMKKYKLRPSEGISKIIDEYRQINIINAKYETIITLESEEELLHLVDVDKFVYDICNDCEPVVDLKKGGFVAKYFVKTQLQQELAEFAVKTLFKHVSGKNYTKSTVSFTFRTDNTILVNKMDVDIYIGDKFYTPFALSEVLLSSIVEYLEKDEENYGMVSLNKEYVDRVTNVHDSKNFDRDAVLGAQRFLYNEYCFSCGADMLEGFSLKHSKEHEITSCPKCCHSMVD